MSSKKKAAAVKSDGKAALVPKLRFPEFRGANGWGHAKVGDLVETVTPPKKLPTSVYSPDGSFPIIDQSQAAVSGWTNDHAALIHEGLPLIAFGDHTCTLKLIDRPFAQGADGIKILKSGSMVGTPYLYQFLTHRPVIIEEYKRHYSLLKEKVVLFPERRSGEQQKIAECLSSVDEVIAAQARKLNALKTHKKGLMQRLLPREGETQPRLRFPEFQDNGEWERKPLSELIASLDAGVSVNSGDRPAASNEIGVLKTSAVTNGTFEPQENKVVFDDVEIGRVKEPVQADTIIISRMNTPELVGANAYVETDLENIFLPDRLWAAKAKPGTVMRFVAFTLGSAEGRAALSKLAKGSSGSMKNISKPEVLGLSIMTPRPSEQRRIASCLSGLESLIAAETQKLEALKRHKRGLMQKLFPSPEDAGA